MRGSSTSLSHIVRVRWRHGACSSSQSNSSPWSVTQPGTTSSQEASSSGSRRRASNDSRSPASSPSNSDPCQATRGPLASPRCAVVSASPVA